MFYNKFTHKEVAYIMDLRLGSVYRLVSKAIETLHRGMKEWFQGENTMPVRFEI